MKSTNRLLMPFFFFFFYILNNDRVNYTYNEQCLGSSWNLEREEGIQRETPSHATSKYFRKILFLQNQRENSYCKHAMKETARV